LIYEKGQMITQKNMRTKASEAIDEITFVKQGRQKKSDSKGKECRKKKGNTLVKITSQE